MNRREMLTGMAVAGATVALSAPTIAKTLPASRAQWDGALARFRHLHDAHEAACTAHSAVEDRYFAERPRQSFGGVFKVGDTEATYNARQRAEREEFERLDAECMRRTGYEASEARQAQACDASWEALGELLATPVPGLAEVVLKIELAAEYGRTVAELGPVCADLRRLQSQEKAR